MASYTLAGRLWALQRALQYGFFSGMSTRAIDPAAVRGREFKRIVKKGGARTKQALVESLCRLARQGDADTSWDLLAEGCDPDLKDKDGWTPLLYASDRGQDRIVKLLLDRGAKVDLTDETSWTPLMAAVDNNNYAVMQTLINSGADVQRVNRVCRSALHLACATGRTRNAALLVDAGADVNKLDKHHWTPLHFAADKGSADITRVLCHTGANVDAVNKLLETPLHLAVRRGNWATAELLLKYGADPDAKDKDGKTAMDAAQESGYSKLGRNLDDKLAKGKRLRRKVAVPDPSGEPVARVVHLDVGGSRFVTSRATLTCIPGSYFWMAFNPEADIPVGFEDHSLGALGPGPGKELTRKSDQQLLIDRDPHMFLPVLEFMRTLHYSKMRALELPEDRYAVDALLREARFYRLVPMMAKILEEVEFRMRKTLRNAHSPKKRHKVVGGRALYKPENRVPVILDKVAIDNVPGSWEGAARDGEHLAADEV
ncbi:unnamed protein product [Ostreobium quekettii]|uniref:BTB domain-containing protein n=1 Tax=Ostreobium quekettii TaxID=121088 RepID=A0A8S1J406_9CHLO|nr:unnamed protein product [Ostreobium quekettii]|eukprot:evm.model.scf_1611.6 EVM.evm.TU.scf_1611.6   scf_1611:19061-24188(-)